MAEKRFKGTTIRNVAKEGDIANSLISYFHKNKVVLYEAIFQHFFDQLEDLIQRNVNLDLERLGTVKALLLSVTDGSARHRNIMQILIREITDNGSIVQKITQQYFNPLYDVASSFPAEGKKQALLREISPLQFLVSVMGMTLSCFVSDPLLQPVGVREPCDSKAIQTRKVEVWR